MAKLSYQNRATGKSYTADAEDVKILKSNPVLANVYSFETEQEKPADPKSAIDTTKK